MCPHLRHLTLRSSRQRPIPIGNQKTAAKTPAGEKHLLAVSGEGGGGGGGGRPPPGAGKEEKQGTYLAIHTSSEAHVIPAADISSPDDSEVTTMQYAPAWSGARSCISSERAWMVAETC
jgi:hypothetical protein